MPLEQLVPIVGAIVAALTAVIGALWRLHLQEDERTRKRLDATEVRLEKALDGMKEHADVADRAVALAEGAVNALRR